MSTPKTVEEILDEYATEYFQLLMRPSQESRELKDRKRNEAITAINELRKADMAYVIGEDVKDAGATIVRNADGSVHSSSAGSYSEHIKNEYREEARLRAEERLQK